MSECRHCGDEISTRPWFPHDERELGECADCWFAVGGGE